MSINKDAFIFKRFSSQTFLYIFIFTHLIGWTVLPAFARDNLPLDAMEGALWGHQLQWGYDKNPFLNGWLTALAVQISPSSGWAIYLFSQLSVCLCFLAVALLGEHFFTSTQTMIAVLVLEGMQYFNIHSIDFNDNTLELSLWAWNIYLFYLALKNPRLLTWIGVGAIAGLGMMTKYYTALLLFSLFVFMLSHHQARAQLKTLPPYIGLFCFILIILPHTIWLFFHDFITVVYALERTNATPSWSNHLLFPIQFTWEQIQVLLPALLLFGLLFLGKRPLINNRQSSLSSFDRNFLLFAALGPLLLTLALSLCFGLKLRAGWGMPLLSLWGLLFILCCPPALTSAKIYRFIAAVFIFMTALFIAYTSSLIFAKDTSTANFPGRDIAKILTQEWHERYHTPLHYIAGSRWVGGNLGFYSADHPAVFVGWNKKHAAWINVEDLEKKGAIFVWEISRKESLPESIKKQFPSLQDVGIREFALAKHYAQAPIKLGIAFLPPKS